LAWATPAPAVPVFYLDTSATGPQTPALLNLSGVASNSTGTLHIWVTSDVRLAGVSLDLVETGNGIKFTGVNVPNPNGPPQRWAFLDGPQIVTDSAVTNIGGAAIPGLAGNGVGAGSTAGANVLIASVNYIAYVGGTANLQLRVGGNGIADYATGGFTQVRFGTDSAPLINGDAFGSGGPVGSIQVGSLLDLPIITPLNLGEVEQTTTISANLIASSDPTWSGLTPTTGTPAIPATLSSTGAFSWDPTGSKRGPKGNGVVYSWTATTTNPQGQDNRVAITFSLIPEPSTATFAAFVVLCVASARRR
jgi:hypothetical protein